MRAWLVRMALPLWAAPYFLVFHSVVTAPLIFFRGPLVAMALIFPAIGIWSSVFYLLLCQERWFDKAQLYLLELKERQKRGLLAEIRKRFSRQLPEEPLFSALWVLALFVVPGSGAFWGVLAVRLAYFIKANKRAWALIWIGCAIEVFWSVLGLTLLINLIKGLTGIGLGGG